MQRKRFKFLSILLTTVVLLNIIPLNSKSEAAGLEIPQRIRPTKETMWNPENIKNTMAAGGYESKNRFSLFITNLNTVKSTGKNNMGQLGNGTTSDSSEFVDVLGKDGIGLLTDVVAISAGYDHSLALKADGKVLTYGNNNRGQLGDGSTTNRSTPVEVEELTDIVAISAGIQHSHALRADGKVFSWGENNMGQSGNGSTSPVFNQVPVEVEGLTDVVAISAGHRSVIALKADRTVWAWGEGYGSTPVEVEGLTDIVAISAGYGHFLALKADRTVWSWGANNYNQVGNGKESSNNEPIPSKVVFEPNISFLTDIIAISAGYRNSVAVKADGTTYAWGEGYGSTPKQIEGLTDIVAISDNNEIRTTLVIAMDGKIYGLEYNGCPEITFPGQKKVAIIPENLLYKFTSPKEREVYEGGKPLFIEWQLISDPVESFDIYYAPYEEWQDESTWIEIEKNVPTSELNPTPFVSDISDGNGGYLEGTKYQYNWTLPDEFIPHIRIIAIPNYE